MPAKNNVLWKPLPKQALALNCPVDDMLFGGAVGGGKTDLLLAAWVQHAQMYGDAAVGLIVRRTLPELKDILKRSRKLFPMLGATWKVSERLWVFKNGASLLLNYLENDEDATRYQGQEFTFVGVDEAGSFKSPDPIDYLRSRMRSPVLGVRKQLILTANPGGKGHQWLHERYVKGRTPYVPFTDPVTNTRRVYIPSRLTDNPFLMADPEYVQRIKGSGPSWLVRALLMGDWDISFEGEIFRRNWWKSYGPGTIPEVLQVVQSWDTGFKTNISNSRSACVTVAITRRGAYVIDLFAKHLEYPDLKREVVERARRFNCYTVCIEDKASGQSLLQDLKRETGLALIPTKATASRLDRWLPVTPLIESGRLLLPNSHDNLSEYIEEMSSARADSGRDDYANATAHLLKYVGGIYSFSDNDPGFSLLDIYS